MKLYSHHGIDDFVVCLGHKGYVVKEYFANYVLHASDVTVDLRSGALEVHDGGAEPWRVTLVDTGETTATGGRLGRIRHHVGDEAFLLTYGDGVADVDVSALVAHHRTEGGLVTLTAVQPPGRFGVLQLDGDRVRDFAEKPTGAGSWINAGFFVVEPAALDLVEGDATTWEHEPLEALARRGELVAYHHTGFWHPMDTLRDKLHLDDLWASGTAPWKVWA
jgi:glucose-1-phosphate cytidylyltransferase